MHKRKVAIVSISSSGWATIRKRWESDLPTSDEFTFSFIRLEDYAPLLKRLSELNSGLIPLWHAFAGRAAVQAAVAAGCETVVLATISFV